MQIINILELFNDFFSCKLSWPQTISILKIFKDFFDCKIVLDANHRYHENIQRLFWLQKCLSRKSSLSWKHSKTFLPAEMFSTQIIIKLKVFKDFFACKIVFDANHHYPENIQRLFRLQYCLRCKSALSWKHWKTFLTAKLSSTQITIILKFFKDFFACNIVSDANHHYPGNIQRFFQWQICLRRKSSLSIILKIFKDFFACKILSDANHHYPANIQRLFRL